MFIDFRQTCTNIFFLGKMKFVHENVLVVKFSLFFAIFSTLFAFFYIFQHFFLLFKKNLAGGSQGDVIAWRHQVTAEAAAAALPSSRSSRRARAGLGPCGPARSDGGEPEGRKPGLFGHWSSRRWANPPPRSPYAAARNTARLRRPAGWSAARERRRRRRSARRPSIWPGKGGGAAASAAAGGDFRRRGRRRR